VGGALFFGSFISEELRHWVLDFEGFDLAHFVGVKLFYVLVSSVFFGF
jgi:hypothetical protein